MDSENSYTGESSSSSETSSGSSDADEEMMEPIRVLGHTMELPQELCEDYSIFREFFSIKTWETLEDKHKDQLTSLLPKLAINEEEEKTVQMLFDHEPFFFSSPLTEFYNNLRHGNYRPDIAKMRKYLAKARAKQTKHKTKSYFAKLLPEVLISRERLLAAVKGAPPGPAPSLPPLPPKRSSKNNYKPLYLRAKQRYFEELAAIQGEVGGEESEDENYPDGPPDKFSNKRKPVQSLENSEQNISGTLSGPHQPVYTSLQCLKNILIAHGARRQYRESHPELNVSGITLEDIKQRVAVLNGSKKFMFGSQKLGLPTQKLKRNAKKDAILKHTKPYSRVIKKTKSDHCNDSFEEKPGLLNIKIKCEQDETDSESSSFVDTVMSPNHLTKKMLDYEMMHDSSDVKHNNSRISYSDSKMDIKQDINDASNQNLSRTGQPVPIKLEDLDGIDMMALPVEIADDSGDVIQVDTSTETIDESLVDPDESLTETTHANFLSLVRALFPARVAHRATKQQLHARCSAVMKSPIAPLNTWYNLSDDWCSELDSALDFLAGERGTHPEDFVPYLQYIPETQTYQWIGAGRDCDAILGRLCERWLRAVSPAQPSSEAPPPRYPTSWTMRAPTNSEVAEFRAQERKRFTMAAKPFTYNQHGYRSVVGPCGRAWGGWGGGTGSALVAAGRPRHATFAALLRDALARLPNGRGTRHDVLTLLKMSQWIAPCSDQALLVAVSAALDKFHSAKRDPIVKYDQRTAIWTYLHRNRNEEDWVKATTSKGRGKAAIVTPLPPALPVSLPTAQPPTPISTVSVSTTATTTLPMSVRHLSPLSPSHAFDLEVGTVEEVVDASDSDVDVDDTNASSAESQLSFAQLLMQATQHTKHAPGALPNKPKGKLVPASAPKVKPTIITKQATPPVKQGTSSKQANLMSQSVKQATFMAQSIKQAAVMTQAKTASMVIKTIPQTVKSNASQIPKANNSPKQTTVAPPLVKQITVQTKPGNIPKSLKQTNINQSGKNVVSHSLVNLNISSQMNTPNAAQLNKSLPSVVTPPQKSPLIKQRPLQKPDISQVTVSVTGQTSQTTTVLQPMATTMTSVNHNPNKIPQGTRSLLIRPPIVQTTVTAANIATTQAVVSRRGVVRVLSPATPSSGKSLISPRALLQSGTATAKKRSATPAATSGATLAHSTASLTTVVSSVPTIVTTSVTTRTVQLPGGRTVQLAGNQTVHLPGGQAVQLTPGHTLQLSSLQLPTHSVRLPSGQTVQLASPQAIQAVKISTSSMKSLNPRGLQSAPTMKNSTSQATVQIPVSSVQLSGQTVQIGGQTVQLAGHTVKLPSGQSVQVASQSVIPSQSVQLPSGQTVQLASGNMQTVQLPGQSVPVASGQSMQIGSQTVQLSGQTVQLAGGQTVQLPSGQTLQLSSGQTVQLSSGQTLQLASGQTVHLANQPKNITQVIRSQASGEKPVSSQPIVAKLLTNAQGQMISLEGMMGSSRTVQAVTSMGGVVPRAGLRVVSPATRLTRPLLLTSAKPLHNIILQQSDGSAIRVTSSGGSASSQTLVLSNIGSQTTTTTSSSAPLLKLQQVNTLQQVKLAQGIKIQQAGTSTTLPTSGGIRNVLMDGQQLKLVGGRHVLARILRPAHPPP